MNFYDKKIHLILWLLLVSFLSHAQDKCDDKCMCGADDLAPAGVMNSHIHQKGKWMLTYQYMRMGMQGNIMNNKNISDNDIFIRYNYMMAPQTMVTEMHMFMLMYGVSDNFSLMLMSSWNSNKMTMTTYGGGNMTMQMPGMPAQAEMSNSQTISGWGDTKISGLYKALNTDNWQIVASLGVNIPTGSNHDLAFPSVFPGFRADYNMQPGRGTWDISPGISMIFHPDMFDCGAQVSGNFALFKNSNGYKYGNEAGANLWMARKWTDWVSNSIRIEAKTSGAMGGYDAGLSTLMEPSADAANYGGSMINIYPGVNFYPGTFFSTDVKIRFEYGFPIYQYANGVQMRNKSVLFANLDLIF